MKKIIVIFFVLFSTQAYTMETAKQGTHLEENSQNTPTSYSPKELFEKRRQKRKYFDSGEWEMAKWEATKEKEKNSPEQITKQAQGIHLAIKHSNSSN